MPAGGCFVRQGGGTWDMPLRLRLAMVCFSINMKESYLRTCPHRPSQMLKSCVFVCAACVLVFSLRPQAIARTAFVDCADCAYGDMAGGPVTFRARTLAGGRGG